MPVFQNVATDILLMSLVSNAYDRAADCPDFSSQSGRMSFKSGMFLGQAYGLPRIAVIKLDLNMSVLATAAYRQNLTAKPGESIS